MKHRLDLFSPETYQRFGESDRQVAGVKARYRRLASDVQPGDLLLCYVTRLSRWCGLLEVTSSSYEDATPRFTAADDPYVIRFRVNAELWLPPELSIPIHDDRVWSALSFTRGHANDSTTWTGPMRTSLVELSPKDGVLLTKLLREQAQAHREYPLDAADTKLLRGYEVRRPDGPVSVTVPDDVADEDTPRSRKDARESIKIQALLAHIGASMGMKVWIPASDRTAVINELNGDDTALLTTLPLNYDSTTIDTIERIDVLWIKRRSIVRAFEVEHTTAIYSGILRMADLLSLQPNMDIRLHIVAPDERRKKVFDEIKRPVFSLLERRPLASTCTFLPYDAIRDIGALPHLTHLSDSIVSEYEESADE